jgi:hypothetical protein
MNDVSTKVQIISITLFELQLPDSMPFWQYLFTFLALKTFRTIGNYHPTRQQQQRLDVEAKKIKVQHAHICKRLFTSLFCKFFVPVCELKHPAKMMQCNIYSCCLLLGDEGKKN